MKWITREKVKVDRVACPWLIKKFVDPEAEFFFVPTAEVATRARELGATPVRPLSISKAANWATSPPCRHGGGNVLYCGVRSRAARVENDARSRHRSDPESVRCTWCVVRCA